MLFDDPEHRKGITIGIVNEAFSPVKTPRGATSITENYLPACAISNCTSTFNCSYGIVATDRTLRPLMNTVGVWVTSSDCPNCSEFFTLASVSGALAQAASFCASRPAAFASSCNLSSEFASAIPSWLSKMLSLYFQKPPDSCVLHNPCTRPLS
jgi:hypothetical protein